MGSKVQKTELLNELKQKNPTMTMLQLNKVYRDVFEVIMDNVAAGNTVNILGFGQFQPKVYKERKGRNLNTGEIVLVPSVKRPKFKVGSTFKQLVDGR